MFLQRSALTAARRAAARPAVARTFTTSFVRRDAARPATPNEQAAALAGTAEKKVGSYKTLKEIRTEEDLFGPGAAPRNRPYRSRAGHRYRASRDSR
ncbi:Cytochrome c oxidase subunit 4 [Fusarium oxysporum]|nr:Cytochrome c oxidase subunit 4 [Fusarium oxysporum]